MLKRRKGFPRVSDNTVKVIMVVLECWSSRESGSKHFLFCLFML